IHVSANHNGQTIRVTIDGAGQHYQGDFTTSDITRLIVNSGPGNNHIEIAENVHLPALLMGSFGNDHIEGGGGSTIIIGGLGSDHIQAGSGGAILIGGITDFDRNLPVLDALLVEWARTDETYSQKVPNLSDSTASYFLNAATVHD